MAQDRPTTKPWYTMIYNIWTCVTNHCFVPHKDLFQLYKWKQKIFLHFWQKENSVTYVQIWPELEEVKVSWKFHMHLGTYV